MKKLKAILLAIILLLTINIYAQTPTCADGSYQYSDILAILSAKCGGCHTTNSTGGFNLNTYAGLLAGGNNCGPAVTPGNATAGASSIIDKTQFVNGGPNATCGANMPTNANVLTPAEFMALETWINAGAPEFCPTPPPTDLACSGGGGLSVTEILADPNSGSANLDANCDGTADSGDDYLIICNDSGAAIDISGFEVYDNTGLTFTFPPGTILAAGDCAVVVDTWPAASGPIPPNVFSGGPAINNGGDQLILYDPGSGTYQSVVFNGFTLDTTVLPAGAITACDEDWGGDTDGMPLTNNGPGDDSLPYECMPPTCTVTNLTVTSDGTCAGDDATYTVCADVAGGSGDYDLVDAGNGNVILSLTGQADGNICYTVTVTGPTTATTLLVDVVDNADITCVSPDHATVTIPECPVVVAMCETLVITEVMYDPCSGGAGTDDCMGGAGTFWDDEGNGEWVEIYNYGTMPVDVSGYLIGDSATGDVYEIPAGTILQPGDYLVIGQAAIVACMQAAGINAVVGCDPGNCPTPQSGPRFNNSGDDVELKDPTGNLCDIITYTGDECGAGDNDGYTFSLNLDPSTFVDGTENDNPADWGVSLAGGDVGSFGGGSPGVLNTLGACVSNITEAVTATCNGTDAVIDISFDYEGSFVTDFDIIVNGAVLTTSTGNALGMGTVTQTITIPNSTTATTITLDVRPQSAPDNICNDTSITIDLPACMDTACPMAVTVTDVSEIICNGGLGNLYSDFQAAVTAANPLDAAQDPDGWGTIVYSAVMLNTGDTPNPPFIDGIHNGINPCAPIPQEAFAYIQCDMGTADVADDTFLLIGNFTIEIWLEPTLTVPTDPGCGITLLTDCNDMANETIEYSTDGGTNYTTTAPMLNPGDADVTVTYQISNPGCVITGTYDLTCPPSDVCTITPTAAANIVCDDNGTPDDPTDDTYTFDITVNGNNPAAGASNTFNDDQGNISIAYGTTLSYGPFPITGGNITVTFTDIDDLLCTAMMMATAPAPCSVPVCDISNVVFTQNCTGNGDEYELCVSFDYANPGTTGQFNIYLDPSGTGTPATIVAGPLNYSDYDAAIGGGATCFTISGYLGDASDLEAGLEVCIGDADAPEPGTGLPPGTVPMGGGLPNPPCTAIIGIFVNACGSNEGQNEFVVLQNGNAPITGNDIMIDTPANDDYDMWEPAATTAANIAAAGWICPCCVAIDGSSTIPPNAVVIVTGNMLDQPYDFTGLCAAAGTVYVLGETSTGSGGHFSNSGGRTTVLNVTNAGGPAGDCIYPLSYTYLTSDLAAGGDGDYVSFSSEDNPTQPAGNNDDPAGTNGTGSNNGCTGPEVVVEQEVECFGCTTLDETACITSVECPTFSQVDLTNEICDGELGTLFTDWQTLVETDTNIAAAIADTNTDAAVIYSSVLSQDVSETMPPPPGTITGTHSNADVCVLEIEVIYAYLLCFGEDGLAGGGDDSYLVLGAYSLIIYPAAQEPTIMVTQGDPECTYAYVRACVDYTVEPALTNEACGTPATDQTVTVTTFYGCTADFTLVKPACDACGAVCEITGLIATPVCNDDGTYCLTVDLTVTAPGASGQYTLDINGTTFGPYNYADLPQTMICDPSFIGDGETGISVTATDTDNTGGAGGLYISSVLADPNMADGNGSGTVDSCDEYIVITNSSANAIDVSGYEIWDDASGGTPRYTIPAGTIIPAGGTLIIYTSDILGMADGCTGVWNNGGDVIYLYSDSGVTLIDSQMYGGASDDEIITFMDPNGGGGMVCSTMITFDELDCMQMTNCPVLVPVSETVYICTGFIETQLSDWQAAVNAANPLDMTQDPDGLGAIFYSSVPNPNPGVGSSWVPDGDVSGITGIHSGVDVCTYEDQIVYAYLWCDDLNDFPGDDIYEEIGSLTVGVYALMEDAVTLNNDGGCCPSITVACPNYFVYHLYNGGSIPGPTPDCSTETGTGSITFYVEQLGFPDPSIDLACWVYGVALDYDCTGPTCQITPDAATNIVCDNAGTPDDPSDDTFTFDITVNGSSTFPGATNTFSDDQGNAGVSYGTTVSYGPFPIAGGNVTVNFTDTEQADCLGMMMAAAPETCSEGPCEDEIAGNVFGPTGCDLTGIEVTIYDNMGNVVVVLMTDMNGVYDSTPTAYPCGEYSVELTNGIPQCYLDAMGEIGPKPFIIDGDDDNSDTDGPNFMPVGIPTLSQWGLISLALLMMIFGAITLGETTLKTKKRRI